MRGGGATARAREIESASAGAAPPELLGPAGPMVPLGFRAAAAPATERADEGSNEDMQAAAARSAVLLMRPQLSRKA